VVFPVGSLSDLQELLEKDTSVRLGCEPNLAFYALLIYASENALNKRLHKYVERRCENFNALIGPNWLVAVLEDIPLGQLCLKWGSNYGMYSTTKKVLRKEPRGD
jgi:hypothetical protein